MKKIKLLPHTADIRLEIGGDSLEELFCAALDGLNRLLKKDIRKKSKAPGVNFSTGFSSGDNTGLLVDFLNEILSQSLARHVVFNRVKKINIDRNHLSVWLVGLKVQKFDRDIKAVSYHGAQIKTGAPQKPYKATVVLDI